MTHLEFTRGTHPVELEFAWRVHAAMEAWTARADLKASILLALQGGALFAVFTIDDRVNSSQRGWAPVLATVASVALVICMALTAAALAPVLGSKRKIKMERTAHLIYFGHLMHWDADELARRYARLNSSEEAVMLAHQIVRLSQLNWRKHRLLQASVALTIVLLAAVPGAGVGMQG
jgi:hypothetical protein